ncbi:hypothetical protein [Aquipuribacter nitratireducens]|uniref:Uncharacterized protein n=1 Tax=Aquipuribacter nitratireducens TaxID=650104 RepID=A0ABW0GR46_9MICO
MSIVVSIIWALLFVAAFALGRFVEESVPGGLEGLEDLEDLAPLTEVDPAEAVDLGTSVELDGYEVTVTSVDLLEPPGGGDPVVTASVEATRTGGGTGEPWFELVGTWFETDGTTSYGEGTCPPDVRDPVEQAGSLEAGETTTFTWCFPVDPGAGSAGYVALGGTFGLGATGVWGVE